MLYDTESKRLFKYDIKNKCSFFQANSSNSHELPRENKGINEGSYSNKISIVST